MGLLNKLWSQADFWDKEENKRQAQAAAKPMPARAPQPQQNVIQRAAPSGLRAGLGVAVATLPGAKPAMSAYKLLDRTKPGKAVIAGAKRSGIGTGQALSGLYDLATPGTGTNRISKTLDQQAKQTDQSVKDQRLNPILYKGGQLGGDIATGMGAGGAAKWAGRGLVKAAPVLSNVPKAVSAVETGVAKAVAPMASKNLGGRIVAKTVQNVANPKYQGVNALYTAQQIGKEASQGKKITPQRVATDAAVGGLVFPAAGAIAGQTAKAAAAPVVNKLKGAYLVRPTRLSDSEVAHLNRFVENRGTNGMTEDVYSKGVAAAQKAGVSTNDVSAMDRVIGDHMTFNTRQAVRKETLQNIKDRLSTPLGEGGYVKNPFVGGGADPLAALKQEALKYKSAEEFVKAQGEPLYHGTTEKIQGDFKYPLYTTPKKDYAQVFADSTAASSISKSGKKLSDAPMVHEFAVNPKARVLDITNPTHRKLLEEQYFGKYSMSYDPVVGKNGHIDWTEGENLAEWIEETKQPFDAIRLDEGGGGIDPSSGLPVIDKGVSYLALNKNALKSKSQLTDLYSQANKPSIKDRLIAPFKDEMGAVGRNIRDTDPLEALKQEASYRSAHQINSKTARNLGDMQSVDDVVAQIKSKYGLTNYDQKDITNLKKIVGNPEADVKIYRASPVNEINDGDWVTTSKTYAQDIKRQNGGKVYEYTVKAKDLNLPENIEDNPSLARFSAFQYKKNGSDLYNQAHAGAKTANTPKGRNQGMGQGQTPPHNKFAQSEIAQAALPQNTTATPQQSGKRPGILNAPLPIDTKGFDAPNNLSLDNTVPPLGKSVERALNDGAPIKDKALNTRLSNSSKLPEPLKQMLDGTYVVQDNKTTIKHAKDLIWRSPQEAEIRALSPKNAVDVQIGVELFNKYANEGNFSKAVDFVNASDSTNAGQMIQILSQYDRTTPEGAVRFATAAIKRFNETHKGEPIALTEQHIKQIVDHAKAIQQMPQGRERNIESQKLMQVINELMPSSKTDKAIAVWKAGLLTSPRTHLRNILGNTVHGIAEAAKDPIAAANDIFLKTVKTKNRSMSATLKGSMSGAKEGASIAREVIKTGFDPTDDITKFDVQRVNWGKSRTQRAAKAYTEAVFRTLGAEDKVFYHSALNRSLYDQAITKAKNEGRRADAGYIKQLVSDPSPTMLETAIKDASIATFKDRNMLAELASNFKRIARKNGVTNAAAEMMMPFTGVPSSVAGQMVAYSPIGLVKGLTKDVRILAGKIKPGDIPTIQRQASQEVGRGVLGSGMLAIGAMLTNTGQMTGQPKDAEEARLWAAQGKQANSVMIGGKWRSINSVGPEALIALAGSKISEGGKSVSEKGANIIKDFMSQTFLQGIQGPMNSINDPGRYAESYLTNQFASGIPNFVKDVARATDNTQRNTKGDGFIDTVKNNIKASIPGQRNDLLPKRDVIGNTMPQEPTGFNAFIDIGNSKTPRSNPVVNELNRLYQTDNGATPSQLKNKQTIAKNKVILDVAQLNELEQKSGGAFSQEMAALMQKDSYKKADDATKADAVKKLSDAVRKQAKLDLFHAGGLQAGGGYEQSPDAPKDLLGRASLYTRAAIKDPIQNAPNIAKGIFTSERARKLTGNTLILERKKGLSTMDGGNKNAQVDHKIALAIGGDNAKGNFQYLSNEDNNKKGQYETKLMKQLADKKINRAEAIRLSKEYAANLAAVKPGGDTASKPIDVTKGAIKSLGGKTSGTETMSADYETALESYKKNVGKMSAAQKIRAEGKLARLKVGKDYNKDAVSLYSVNKNELATYLALEEKGKDKKKLAEQIMAYDQALYEAGLISKPKFKYGISSTGSSRSSGSSSGSRKGTKKSTKVASIVMPTYSSANRKMQSALKSTRTKA